MARDLHAALRSEVLAQANANHLHVALVRMQWGKEDIAYGLHVSPSSYTSYGVQKTDFLSYLGFQRYDGCTFVPARQCYAKWVDADFNVEAFGRAFERAYKELEQAERALEACGFRLEQPEGWGFHFGKPASGRTRVPTYGDGHTSRGGARQMKSTEDASFNFKFTFIDGDSGKQFVTHYRPKHLPVSSEIDSVFKYLGLQKFEECPEFDFESCYFRTVNFVGGDSPRDRGNVDYVHMNFDAHDKQFSVGIQKLLAANNEIEQIGMTFLPFDKPVARRAADIGAMVVRPASSTPRAAEPGRSRTTPAVTSTQMPDEFDVAISFAGPERDYAKALAEKVKNAGFVVFYDDYFPEQLWGKNLTAFFDDIYRRRARFCVPFVSKDYKERKWTIHEFRSAQARALEEKGNEYILPVKVDDTDLDGLPPNVGYLGIGMGIDVIADLLIKKLKS